MHHKEKNHDQRKRRDRQNRICLVIDSTIYCIENQSCPPIMATNGQHYSLHSIEILPKNGFHSQTHRNTITLKPSHTLLALLASALQSLAYLICFCLWPKQTNTRQKNAHRNNTNSAVIFLFLLNSTLHWSSMIIIELFSFLIAQIHFGSITYENKANEKSNVNATNRKVSDAKSAVGALWIN